MKIKEGKVVASATEKLLVFGRQNMGKPEVFDGNTILVRHSIKWRLALLASVIAPIAYQYFANTMLWYIGFGLLVVPFMIIVAFFYMSELYIGKQISD